MRYFIIAGEVSGDEHGAALIADILKHDAYAEIDIVGGQAMETITGKTSHIKLESMSVMGLAEVIKKLPSLMGIIKRIKWAIMSFAPDMVIFIDFPGMNMRLAKWSKEQGYKTAYYILPKVWAWGEKRVAKLKKHIDLPLSILTFELAFFKKHNWTVHYVGNPTLQKIKALKLDHRPKGVIGLFPGSRKQEIEKMARVFVEAAAPLKDQYDIKLSRAPHLPLGLYKPLLEKYPWLTITEEYHDLLCSSNATLVTSGTATLDAAIIGAPMVVGYITSPLTYSIAKKVIKISHISLPNLLLQREVVSELIQDKCTNTALHHELIGLLHKENDYAIKNELTQVLASEHMSAGQHIVLFMG